MSMIVPTECPSVNLQYLMKPWQKFLLHDDGLFMKDCVSTYKETIGVSKILYSHL